MNALIASSAMLVVALLGGSSRSVAISPAQAPVEAAGPLVPRQPHFAPKATNVIFLFMSGGPSHVDLFDPKPELKRREGEKRHEGERQVHARMRAASAHAPASAAPRPSARRWSSRMIPTSRRSRNASADAYPISKW